MNRKLPYEKIISEKLQRLNLPDPEITWKQMNQKLDESLPLSNSNEKPGKRIGWWVGLSGILLIAGIWTVSQLHNTTISNDSRGILSPASDNTELSPSSAPPDAANADPDNETSQALNKKATVTPIELLPEPSRPVAAELIPGKINLNTPETSIESPHGNENILINSELPVITDGVIKRDNALTLNDENAALPSVYPASPENDINDNKGSVRELIVNHQTLRNTITGYSDKESITANSTDRNNELTVPAYVSALPDVRAQKKMILREMRKSEKKEERELSKSYRTYPSFWGESPDRWFAAGIAPYQNIAVANQQPYHFNSSAGRNIIPDYIPSPYLQFHVTNRVYLQSEFQFNAPQSTPSLLMSQRNFAVPSGNLGYAENIYLRKLYYFNMPVSFYYSPVRNFYIGSGLQFSSFNSGLAEIEQRSSTNTLLNSTTIKLKDDSLSSKITGSEWRYLFDANYYVNRFMFGVRYNQALNSFINLRVNNTLPPTQSRNQAVQIYLRYNLIVSDKKR